MKTRNLIIFILLLGAMAGAMYAVARYSKSLVEPEAVAPADSAAAVEVPADTAWVEVDTLGTVGP